MAMRETIVPDHIAKGCCLGNRKGVYLQVTRCWKFCELTAGCDDFGR